MEPWPSGLIVPKGSKRFTFMINNTNSDSKIERGDKEEATEAYISVRRGDDDEVNNVI
jgi:hypothetical protein